jgi:hypothetical protein
VGYGSYAGFASGRIWFHCVLCGSHRRDYENTSVDFNNNPRDRATRYSVIPSQHKKL